MKENNLAPIQAWESLEKSFGADAQKESATVNLYRYDIFKGVKKSDGTVVKVRSVGIASIRDGSKTYIIQLRTFPGFKFYLLPNKSNNRVSDYAILTREESRRPDQKFFWCVVGEGTILKDANRDLLELKWDLFGDELYMNIKPYKVIEVPSRESSEVA